MEHRSVEDHLAGLRTAVAAFATEVSAAGPDARVPTCPSWTVRHLLAHQGMVHRWARAQLLGEECHPPTWNAQGQQVDDPVAWLLAGADDLVATLEAVTDDVRAPVFLNDAPPPRTFWARRQCHETTIHAVDALAARLGGPPPAQDAGWVEEATALDGIDELLTGFVTRGRSRFAGAGPRQLLVRADGTARAWRVRIGADGEVVTTRESVGDDSAVDVVHGPARALYLALWNRSAPGSVADDGGVLDVWRRRARVRWS